MPTLFSRHSQRYNQLLKSVTTDTHSLVLSYVYRHRLVRQEVVRVEQVKRHCWHWQTSGIATLKGDPLRISRNLNAFGVGQNVNVVGNYHVSNPNFTQWINPAAFQQAPHGSRGCPRYFSDSVAGLRQLGHEYPEGASRYRKRALPVPSDMFNAFNHPNFTPNTTLGPIWTIGATFSPRLVQAAQAFIGDA
jgi:hypothetical protein